MSTGLLAGLKLRKITERSSRQHTRLLQHRVDHQWRMSLLSLFRTPSISFTCPRWAAGCSAESRAALICARTRRLEGWGMPGIQLNMSVSGSGRSHTSSWGDVLMRNDGNCSYSGFLCEWNQTKKEAGMQADRSGFPVKCRLMQNSRSWDQFKGASSEFTFRASCGSTWT